MPSCAAPVRSSTAGELPGIFDFDGSSANQTSTPSPQPPTPIIRRRPQWIQGETQRCSIPHPTVSIVSPPLLIMKMKLAVSPSAPWKCSRKSETAAIFFREPYEAAIDREYAASVAAELEHTFWAPKMANAEGIDLKIENYLITLTGAKLSIF